MERAPGIAEEAARWYARLQAPDCTPEERLAFDEWRAADPRHAAAWRRVELVLRLVAAPARERTAAPPRKTVDRRRPLPLAAAAAVLALTAAAWFLALRPEPAAPPLTLANATRELQVRTLDDGSTVHLDVGARLRVEFDAGRRRVELIDGRALFDVARDASRPFAVRAGEAETVALGTTFQVERRGDTVAVLLAEGAVRVADTATPTRWQLQLAPGTALRWDPAVDARPRTSTVDAVAATAWTSGRYNFRDTPLQQVLEELNRYGERKIVLGDASLAGLAVGGSFVAGDALLIARTLEAVLPVRAEDHGGDEILLLPR